MAIAMMTRRLALSSASAASSAVLRVSSRPATATAATTTFLRASLSTAASRAPRSRGTALATTARPQAWAEPRTTTATKWIRWSSESATGSRIWSFEEIQNLTTNTTTDASKTTKPRVTLIDTREPGELASTGRIPGSVNVPITTSPDSFHISADEFEDRHGFGRPAPDDEVIFYCKAGVRSRAAAGIARDAGWTRVGEYPGSWVEWAGKGGKVER